MNSNSLLLLILAALSSCMGNILIKQSRLLVKKEVGYLEQFLTPHFLFGVVFYLINLLIFAKVLETSPVSIAYPILAGAGFLFLAISSTIFLGENLGTKEIFGMILIVVGVAFLAK